MTNQEILDNLTIMINMPNTLEMYEFGVTFNAQYIKSDFYKKTKLPLQELVQLHQERTFFNWNRIFEKIQTFINGLDFSAIRESISSGEIDMKEQVDKMQKLFAEAGLIKPEVK